MNIQIWSSNNFHLRQDENWSHHSSNSNPWKVKLLYALLPYILLPPVPQKTYLIILNGALVIKVVHVWLPNPCGFHSSFSKEYENLCLTIVHPRGCGPVDISTFGDFHVRSLSQDLVILNFGFRIYAVFLSHMTPILLWMHNKDPSNLKQW